MTNPQEALDWYTKKQAMTNELEPCPFCGGEVELKYIVTDWAIDCPTCERHHWESERPCKYKGKEGLIEWWNTRYKRTCKMEAIATGEHACYEGYERIFHCCNCGDERAIYAMNEDGDTWAEPPKFCPNCGAEVIND